MVHVWDDPAMELHVPGPNHPDQPERLITVRSALSGHPKLHWHTPAPATAQELSAVHDPSYVAAVLATRGQPTMFDEDTYTSEDSVDAALLAAGAVRDAVNSVITGHVPAERRALALVRPPGHHAEHARAMGFCLFNNVAFGAVCALQAGIERVLIVDWDVHHGNGTQQIFEHRPEVMFFSTHQGPDFYPGTGLATERGAGNLFNCPLPPGAGHDALIAAFTETLLPASDAFAPQLVLVSAGFDAHRDDPLGELCATEQTFADLCRICCTIAKRHAQGRIVLVLEGGYHLGALAASVRAVTDVLSE